MVRTLSATQNEMEAVLINVPNAITIGRVAVALATVALCFDSSDQMRWAAFVLTIVVIWADGLDGYFARKLNQSTKMGAVLDIAGDRVVEMAYWIVFAALAWIPVWVPILFLVRGTFVDAVRAQASEQGFTAFGEKTMMESPIGKFIVASNFMRFGYAVVKAVAFALMIAAHTSQGQVPVLPWGGQAAIPLVPTVAICCVYIAALMCVLRGIPVIIEGRRLLS
jgi:CDP-diacylglycerol--glycerol-3-phosphate 3-phosphatidyltransferase